MPPETQILKELILIWILNCLKKNILCIEARRVSVLITEIKSDKIKSDLLTVTLMILKERNIFYPANLTLKHKEQIQMVITCRKTKYHFHESFQKNKEKSSDNYNNQRNFDTSLVVSIKGGVKNGD